MINIKNSIYGVVETLATPILMLLALPIFLSSLGMEGYAIWVLVNSVIASLAIFNFGGPEVVIKFISANRGGGNKESAGRVFSTVFMIQSIAVAAIYILFLITAPIVIQVVSSNNIFILIDVLYVAIPLFFMRQSEELLYSFFRGYEQFGDAALISVISKVLFFSTQMLIALFTESVFNVFYGALIISTLLFFMQILYIKIMHKKNISFSKANINTAKFLLNFGSWNWLSSLISILKVHSDKWLVSWLLGIKIFGIYSIGILIFNQLYNILASSIYWIFPEISKENLDKKYLAKKYWWLLFYMFGVSLIVSIFLTEISFIFKLWLGEDVFQYSQYYIKIFLLLLPVFTLNIVSYFYLLGLGLVRDKFFADLISLLVKVITIWLVIEIYNIKEWMLFFLVFFAVEFVLYAIIISKNLPIKLTHLVAFFLLQVVIFFIRILN